MESPSKFNCLLLVVRLVVAGLPAAAVVAQTSPVDDSHSHQQPAETRQPDSQTQHAEPQEETQEEEEEVKAAQATARQTGYSSAHVSSLLLDGKQPDLVFQKSLDTFAKRHHVRIWKKTKTYGGREVWVGAATTILRPATAGAARSGPTGSTLLLTLNGIGWKPICCLPGRARLTPTSTVRPPRKKLPMPRETIS
jgi:hypothetical protein